MIRNLLFIIILCCVAPFLQAQENTVGLLSYVPSKVYEGYNLIYPHNQPNVYLLDNCGEIVHTWEDEADVRPGNTAYLMEDGRIVKCKRPASVAGNPIWAGGGGATVEIRDWENNLEWSFTLNDSLQRLHHDIAVKPNGNILMIVWEYKSEAEAIQAGRDTALLAQDALWPDYIIEVNPSTDEIVWEWHVWDHLIQDYDATKDNYGVVAEHPELIDLNWDTNDAKADWMHSNSIDYSAENEQILLSVPQFHEVWIIDNSTTTEQAAGHFGGRSNMGGDIMYRWGNPMTYDRGTEADQQLFYQHDAHWIDDPEIFPNVNFGKIAVYNNRVGADFSTVNIFNPGFDMYKWTYPLMGNTHAPADFDWTYLHPEPTRMWSTGLSSVQILPNGNTLICVGRFGYSFETTPDDEIVWEYVTPIIGGAAATQGDTLAINNNLTFRMDRFPSDHPAFEGRDLSAKGFLELEPDEDFCDQILSSVEAAIADYKLEVFPNPSSDRITIEWEAGRMVDIEIFNLIGQQITQFEASGGRKYLDVSSWESGMYFIRVNQEAVIKLIVE